MLIITSICDRDSRKRFQASLRRNNKWRQYTLLFFSNICLALCMIKGTWYFYASKVV